MFKPLFPVIVVSLLYSCNQTYKKSDTDEGPGKEWELLDSTVSKNTYTKSNLLDTTCSTNYSYFKGRLIVVLKSITVRNYDTYNNLISEKEFEADKSTVQPETEDIYHYDKNNKLTHSINMVYGKLAVEDSSEFNGKGWCIKKVLIAFDPKEQVRYKNIDSTNKHKNDWLLKHDTTCQTYFYDSSGNVLKILNRTRNNKIISTVNNEYSGNHLLLQSNTTNPDNKLISSNYFIYTDSFVKEIRDSKELFFTDTIWRRGDNVFKMVNKNIKSHILHLTLVSYDSMGNQIKSVNYKREYVPY